MISDVDRAGGVRRANREQTLHELAREAAARLNAFVDVLVAVQSERAAQRRGIERNLFPIRLRVIEHREQRGGVVPARLGVQFRNRG